MEDILKAVHREVLNNFPKTNVDDGGELDGGELDDGEHDGGEHGGDDSCK